jgi:cytochrome c2
MNPFESNQPAIRIPWVYLIGAFFLIFSLWMIFSPPRIWINVTKRVDLSEPVRTGEVLVNRYECRNCHIIGDSGGWIAPSLTGITTAMEDELLRQWLREPNSVQGPTAMPDFTLSDSEIEAIVSYLQDVDASH